MQLLDNIYTYFTNILSHGTIPSREMLWPVQVHCKGIEKVRTYPLVQRFAETLAHVVLSMIWQKKTIPRLGLDQENMVANTLASHH